ncbi:putative toxin-antitoxin system toxin component, PIN family [bacterium]|nr:putative toxin-antitoxin system toxin component, PIN family [bacterium]
MKNNTEIIDPQPVKEQICRDKDDDNVISLALSAKSDYIISGDNDLLALRQYESICILSPRDFWNVLQKQRKKGLTDRTDI